MENEHSRIRPLKTIGDRQDGVTRGEGDAKGTQREDKGKQKRGQVSPKGGQGRPKGGQVEAKESPNGSQDLLLDSQFKSQHFRIPPLKTIGDRQNGITRGEGDGKGAQREAKGRQTRGQVSPKGGQGRPRGGQVEAKERPNGSQDLLLDSQGSSKTIGKQ